MNLAYIEEQSFIYGPGCRFVIWTQGCSIRCDGCWNQEMWDFNPKILLSVQEIFEKIAAEKEYIEGITILGGEPLEQISETVELLQKCKNENLTAVLFTGYEICEIKDKRIFELCDILITGRFDSKKEH